jgi:hypothetical protein
MRIFDLVFLRLGTATASSSPSGTGANRLDLALPEPSFL